MHHFCMPGHCGVHRDLGLYRVLIRPVLMTIPMELWVVVQRLMKLLIVQGWGFSVLEKGHTCILC